MFSADQGSPAVCRIGNIRTLRAAQFPEDAGPLAHPVQPQSYLRIDNFYTPTVYEKGAEVIRMMHTLLGPERFRRGMDLYIARNDNHAATIGDFVAAMQEAGGIDLSHFSLWYAQAGTPEITVEDHYDAATRSYELSVAQRVPPTPGQPEKQPMPIPLAIGLLGPNGDEMPTRLDGESEAHAGTRVLLPDSERSVFRFVDVPAAPVPSVLRDFSAPVKLQGVPLGRLKFLAIHDTDPVARWDAGQQVAMRVLLDRVAAHQQGGGDAARSIPIWWRRCGIRWRMPIATWPSPPKPSRCPARRRWPTRCRLSRSRPFTKRATVPEPRSHPPWHSRWRKPIASWPIPDPTAPTAARSAAARLRNVCLSYLAAGDKAEGARLAKAQFDAGGNMTDVLAALAVLVDIDCPERDGRARHILPPLDR